MIRLLNKLFKNSILYKFKYLYSCSSRNRKLLGIDSENRPVAHKTINTRKWFFHFHYYVQNLYSKFKKGWLRTNGKRNTKSTCSLLALWAVVTKINSVQINVVDLGFMWVKICTPTCDLHLISYIW